MVIFEKRSAFLRHILLRQVPRCGIKVHANLKQLPRIRRLRQRILLFYNLRQRRVRALVQFEFKKVKTAACHF